MAFAIAALAGIFLANVMVLNIALTFVAIKAFPAVILGGLESVPGAIIGGVTIGVLETFVGGYLDAVLPGAKELTAFVVLFLVLMIRPYGLFGKGEEYEAGLGTDTERMVHEKQNIQETYREDIKLFQTLWVK